MKVNYTKKTIMHVIVGLGDGGAEGTLFKLVTNEQNYKHVVISLTDKGKYGNLLINNNIDVHYLNFVRNKINFFKILRLLKIISMEKPKIIQTWMYHSDFISILFKIFFPKIKIFWSIRNTTYKFKDSKFRFIISKLCSFFSYFVPSQIISCGEIAMMDHINFGYSKNNWHIIFNGVDTNKFKPNKNLSTNPYQFRKNFTNIPLFGMVARYDRQKGFKILLKALKLLSEKQIKFHCFLVGKNVDTKNLELIDLINRYQLKDKITLLGQKIDLEFFYNSIDMTILSSINGEGFPNVLIESMACGTPCIVTDVGESRLIIGNTGWLAVPNDEFSLFSKIEESLIHFLEKKVSTKTINARSIVIKKFSLELMIQKYVKLWTDNLI